MYKNLKDIPDNKLEQLLEDLLKNNFEDIEKASSIKCSLEQKKSTLVKGEYHNVKLTLNINYKNLTIDDVILKE